MKVNVGDLEEVFFPFVEPDGKAGNSSICIVVHSSGAIKLINPGSILLLDAKAAQTLAEALLHAVSLAEKGRDGGDLNLKSDVR